MDIETYMREARRFDNHKPETMLDALAHGLMAEVGEVAECVASGDFGLNLLHELGDVAWNLIRLADVLGVHPDALDVAESYPPPAAGRDVANLVSRASRVSGVLEKSHRTAPPNGPVEPHLAREVAGAWSAWEVLTWHCSWGTDQAMQANIDKLTARYAERGLPVKEAS